MLVLIALNHIWEFYFIVKIATIPIGLKSNIKSTIPPLQKKQQFGKY